MKEPCKFTKTNGLSSTLPNASIFIKANHFYYNLTYGGWGERERENNRKYHVEKLRKQKNGRCKEFIERNEFNSILKKIDEM